MRAPSAPAGLWPLVLSFLLLGAGMGLAQDRPSQAGLGGIAQGETLSKPSGDEGLDLDGDLRRAYDRGRKRGKEDFRASLSRSYRHHDDEYDRYTESAFRRGYEQAYDELSDARVRDFVEVLVEKQAKKALKQLSN